MKSCMDNSELKIIEGSEWLACLNLSTYITESR